MSACNLVRYAFLASTFIAITCGIAGVYVAAGGFPFLAHTLSEIGFAEAAFVIWVGQAPSWGMVLLTLLGSINVGESSMRSDQKESAISAISALFVGLSVLFLAIAGSNSRYATNTLFDSIIGVDKEGVIQLVILSTFVLAIIFPFLRKLNYDSFDYVGAVSHHINTGLISVISLVTLALAVSIGTQVAESLLVFILLTLPSSGACYLGRTIPAMLCWSVGTTLVGVWAGLVLGYVTNLSMTFFISIIEVGIYLLVYGVHVIKK